MYFTLVLKGQTTIDYTTSVKRTKKHPLLVDMVYLPIMTLGNERRPITSAHTTANTMEALRSNPAGKPETLLQQCRAAQARHQLFVRLSDRPVTVVVAVSGGVDSVALLHLLHHLTAEWGLTLHIAHLDHNLRPDSAADAAFVAQLAQESNLPFHTQRLPAGLLTSDADEGLEAAARRARYGFLTQVAVAVTPPDQLPVIALAHHANDQAETLLLHLVRGSGLRGLGGMRWVSPRTVGELWPDAPADQSSRQMQLVRPLLDVTRADLLRYAQTHALTWREDSSNSDQRFARNRLRHTVLPALATLNPNLIDTLTRTAQIVQAEADRLAALDQATLATLLLEPQGAAQANNTPTDHAPERVVLDLAALAAHPTATQRGVLRAALAWVATPATNLDFAHSETLLLALHEPWQSSGPHALVANLAWSVAGATATTPARLSLHRQDSLPFAPAHPWLDEKWRATIGKLSLSIPGTTPVDSDVGSDWVLEITCLPSDALPSDWRATLHPWQTVLDADQVATLRLTTPQPGQRFAPLGMGGRHKLLGDFFTDRKTPVSLRPGWPIIVDGATDTVLWVCGAQPGHHARLTAATRTVLRLAWHATCQPSICEPPTFEVGGKTHVR